MRGDGQNWWQDQFVTLMVIPERTRRVHKVVVPFFLVKLGVVLISLLTVFLIIMGIDYVHVLGRMAENKRLKGENYKLRQDMQLIRNKVDLMESTVERVRNYAKKLQVLTGQAAQTMNQKTSAPEMPWGNSSGDGEVEGGEDRAPAAKPAKGRRHPRSSQAEPPPPTTEDATLELAALNTDMPLMERADKIAQMSLVTETGLSELQIYLLAQSAVIAATPSIMPIAGTFSSTFGYRRHPITGSYVLHAGVDIAAESGTPVRAPADGTVLFSGYKEGYGKAIVIDHGYNIRTLFGHASKLFVTQGQKLKRGEKIAEVGSTGRSTGPHLHFEIRKNGIPLNPVTFVSRAHF